MGGPRRPVRRVISSLITKERCRTGRASRMACSHQVLIPKMGSRTRFDCIQLHRHGTGMTCLVRPLRCLRRATYWDPEMGKEDPAKKGVCSNYLCDSKPGDDCKMTGPSSKVMLMPEENSKTDY